MVINGWTLYAHPLFADEYRALKDRVSALKAQDPKGYRKKSVTKRLAAIQKVILEMVPADPSNPKFRQGGTLGDDYKHWFRAKFLARYRLFFRYHSEHKVIVYSWMNDEDRQRKKGDKNDSYTVFSDMLEAGNPPDDLNELLAQCSPLSRPPSA